MPQIPSLCLLVGQVSFSIIDTILYFIILNTNQFNNWMVLKKFDFFRKIQIDQEHNSATGGIFTIAALIAGVILIIMSLGDFYTTNYYTYLTVDTLEVDYLFMRIDITFNKMPCQPIEMNFHDELQYVDMNLQRKLQMFTVDADGKQQKFQEKNDISEAKKAFNQDLAAGKGCRLVGILNIPKTPGIITISPAKTIIVDRDKLLNCVMSYKLTELQFGSQNNTFQFPIAHKSPGIQKYLNQLEQVHAKRQFISDFTNDTHLFSFYSHIKIIPVKIQHSDSQVQKGQKYRYSIQSGKGALYTSYPQLELSTQIEPINIVYKRQQPKLYDLIVKILAVVGGAVATIGIFNSLSHFIFNIK